MLWPRSIATQKLIPSLQTPLGCWSSSCTKLIGVRSAAFQSESVALLSLVTATRWPSNAAELVSPSPFPVKVASRAPEDARTTAILLLVRGTQMLLPSNTREPPPLPLPPRVTDWRTAPEE